MNDVMNNRQVILGAVAMAMTSKSLTRVDIDTLIDTTHYAMTATDQQIDGYVSALRDSMLSMGNIGMSTSGIVIEQIG